MSLRIVIDGAGDMPEGWAEQFDIDVIPINIHFNNQAYLQGIDLSDDEFYFLAGKSGAIPKTSQPTPQQFVDFYQRIAEEGDTVLSMHITSQLSGTYESAVLAAKELDRQYEILPFDSESGSAALGFMCKEARLMDRAGKSIQDILDRMTFIRSHITIVLTLDTLDFAVRSGRVKALQAALASLLRIKPVVILKSGVLQMADRVRTRKRALEHILNLVWERVDNRDVNIAVVHSCVPEIAEDLLEKVRQRFNCCESIITNLSIGVAANLGPGTIGLVAYPVAGE